MVKRRATPWKRGQRLFHRVERHLQLVRHRDGGQRVEHVVHARHAHRELAQRLAAPVSPKLVLRPRKLDVPGRIVRLRRQAVGDVPAVDARQQVLHVRMVEAQHREAVKRHLLQERDEGLLHGLVRSCR